jgi:DNA invertase Pin-like site-specific DNA recombinase
MKLAYAREVEDAGLEAQHRALAAAGAEQVAVETESSALLFRPALERLITGLRPGDELIVWRLDLIAGSVPELLRHLEEIAARSAKLTSLTEGFDSASEAGRLAVRLIRSIAVVDEAGARERFRAGMAAARRQHALGRPPSLTEEEQAEALRKVAAGEQSQSAAARMFGVSPATISRLVRRAREG